MADEKAPAPEAAPEAPKYLTVEDFNRAASARDKRLEQRLEKMLAERAAPKPAPADDDADEPQPAAAQGAAAPSSDAAIKRLEKMLERERKAREATEATLRDNAAKSARDEERSRLAEQLTAEGITGAKLKAAVALLHTEERRIKRNDQGSIVYVGDDGDETDLKAGLKSWLSTDDGKSFLPPRGAQGSGTQPARGRLGEPLSPRDALRGMFSGMLTGKE